MLERNLGCLETGSLRRLFPGSHQPLKSRRMLHSTFWDHGAIELGYYPLWTELGRISLSVPIPVVDESDESHIQSIVTASVGNFLDFLYPSGVVKLMRQYSTWKVGTQNSRKLRSRFGGLEHRLYTSIAIDTSPKFLESAAGLHEGSVSGENTTKTATYKPLSFLTNSTPQSPNPALNYFDILQGNNDFDKAWQQFTTCDLEHRNSMIPLLLAYLSKSNRQVDEERAVSIFEEIRNTAGHEEYASLIKVYLNRGLFQNAMELYLEGLKKFKVPAGADVLLAYALEKGNFQSACDIWKTFVRSRENNPSLSYNIWLPSDKLPSLPDRIIQLAEFVNVEAAKRSDLKYDINSSVLIVYLAFRALLIASDSMTLEPAKFDKLLMVLRRWDADTSQRYEKIIERLALSGHSQLSLQCYQKYRQRNTRKISRPILDKILKIACEHYSVRGMKQVLDDWVRYYSKPPAHVYKMCMTAYARQGEVDTVHTLFEQCLLDHGGLRKIKNTNDFTPLLDVHARSGELTKVLEIFSGIKEKCGLEPNITCWNILIKAYGKRLDIDGAFTQFQRLLASSVVPDSYTYGSLMGICAAHGDLDQIMELYQQVESRRIPKTAPMIDCIVLGYIQENRLLQAEKICIDALSMNLKGSLTRMWNYLLTAYAMRRDLENTNRILSRMRDFGVDYDGATYSALMQVLSMIKQPERAYNILKYVMPEAGVKATGFHYAVVMGGYIATGEFHNVFKLRRRMLQNNIKPNISTRLMTMKASVMSDQRNLESTPHKQRWIAERYFRDAYLAPNGQEVADTMKKGVGFESIDIAYLSSYFSYLIFVLGQRNGAFQATELYQQYIENLPEERRDEVSLKVLSAMMAVSLRNSDYENVQQLWDLAFKQAKRLGQPYRARESSADLKILPFHEQALAIHLSIQIRSLTRQQKIDQLHETKAEAENAGFVLDVKNWNIYIQCLARSNRYKQAFDLCELMLMDGWSGWPSSRWKEPQRNRLPQKLRNLRKNKKPVFLRPFHRTFLHLGKAYMDLQDEAVESESARKIKEYLQSNCTRTMNALNTMEREDDELEREILRGF